MGTTTTGKQWRPLLTGASDRRLLGKRRREATESEFEFHPTSDDFDMFSSSIGTTYSSDIDNTAGGDSDEDEDVSSLPHTALNCVDSCPSNLKACSST